jgi:DNA-binding beta-propeller fold protein YncE
MNPTALSKIPATQVGQGDFQFDARADWAQMPAGISWQEATSVAVDSQDRVYVFNRGEHPVIVFDRSGRFLQSWGEGVFARPHGITIGPDDSLYLTDDLDHTVRKFNTHGKLLLTLGTSGQASNTGATSVDYRTITHAGPPFHFPTNVALSPTGEIYVTDGYGNARVHKFSPTGELLLSWGAPGSGPGEFHVPHGIAVDGDGNVVVADRENDRLQIFSPQGEFLSAWIELARPSQIAFDAAGNLIVAELGYRAGMWPGTESPTPDATGGRISIFDPARKLLSRWGGGEQPTKPGDFFAPHHIAIDSRGDIYVAEVTWSAGGKRGLIPADCHSLQKFIKTMPG